MRARTRSLCLEGKSHERASAKRRPPGLGRQENASTLFKNTREVLPPSVKMAVTLGVRKAGLRLRSKFGGEDGG